MFRTVSAQARFLRAKHRWKDSVPERIIIGTDHEDSTLGAVGSLLRFLRNFGHASLGLELPSDSTFMDHVRMGGFFSNLAMRATIAGYTVVPVDIPANGIETALGVDTFYHALALLRKHRGDISKARHEIDFQVRKRRFILEALTGSDPGSSNDFELQILETVAEILASRTSESIIKAAQELSEERETHMLTRILSGNLTVAVSGDDHARALQQALPGYSYLFI